MLVGLDWAHAFSCIRTLHSLYFVILNCIGAFLRVSFPLSLSSFRLVASWHLNKNLLRPGTLFILGHLLLLIPPPLLSSSVMRRPNRTSLRTSLDEVFIRNAKSFYQTSLTLTYPLSSTVRVGSHCVMSRSLVCPCLYRSSTLTCIDLIIQCLSLLLAFEVRALWSHRILYLRCFVS